MNPSHLLLSAALLVPLASTAALAQTGQATAATSASAVKFCEGGRCEGTQAADTIIANNATQRVVGFGGDDDIELDLVFTSGSSDVGDGGPGRDCIDGGAGNDLMLGGPGDDDRPCEFTAFVNPQAALTGGPGDDRIDGGAGNDTMDGIFDDDTLLGGPGDDLLQDPTPADKDRLFGGLGNDRLEGRDGGGDDLIDGGPGRDDCIGDPTDRFVNCERIAPL